jgi:hypothetical protein
LETTYFFIEFITSPNGSSPCSGQYAAPLVVEDAAHQHGVRGGVAGADSCAHLVVEVREVPLAGRLDDAIEGDEEVRLDLAH